MQKRSEAHSLATFSLREIHAKSILSRSRIPGAAYCVNPYVGCSHACRYCYASFMKRFTGHTEPWGAFVDARVNAPEVLEAQLERARPGTVMVSSVTDPYQPLEERYQLTRRCLAALLQAGFPVTLLTKSPLVLRDLDLLEQFGELEVGITVTTDDEEIRAVFEPGAPPVRERIEALRRLRSRGVRTYAFIGPLLPMDPGRLSEALRDHVDYVLVDRMNYASKTARIFARMGLGRWLEPALLREVTDRLVLGFPAGRAIVL